MRAGRPCCGTGWACTTLVTRSSHRSQVHENSSTRPGREEEHMDQRVTRRRLMLGAATGTALSLLLTMPAGAVTGTAVVTTDVLRIRSGPSTGFTIVGRTYLGDTVQVLEGPTNGFYRITAGSVTGWSSGDYLRITASTTPPPTIPPTGTGTATVTANLNLRSGPGTSYAVLKVMPAG